MSKFFLLALAAVFFLLASCRTEFPTATVFPPFRYCPMEDGKTYPVLVKFNEAPVCVTLPSPGISRITTENVTDKPNQTNAGFYVVRDPNNDFLYISALSQNQKGKIILKYNGEIHTLFLEEVSRYSEYDPRQFRPDRTVVLYYLGNPGPKTFLMNPMTVYDILCRCTEPPVCINFPSPAITKIDGVNITTDPKKTDADFLIVFKPGDSFFEIRPLRQYASASINVIYNKDRYVFSLHEITAAPDEKAFGTVIMKPIGR